MRRKVVSATRPLQDAFPNDWKCKLACGHFAFAFGRSKNSQPPTAPYTVWCPLCEATRKHPVVL